MAGTGGSLRTGVLFDFDGTLVDDVDTLFEAARSVLRAAGFDEAAEADFEALRDLPPRRALEEIHVPIQAVPRLLRRLRRELRQRLLDIELADDTRQLIRDLHGSGFVLGIMSSNSPPIIRDVIDRSGVAGLFDFVARGGGVRDRASRLRRVVRRRSTSVRRWVYVGDEIRDFEASKTCGIPFVGVGWGVTSVEAFTAAGARLVAPDLGALGQTLETLRSDGPDATQ